MGSSKAVKLQEYVDTHGILWQPIAMRTWVEEGQPRKQFLPNGLPWTPKTTDFRGAVYKGGKCEGQGVSAAELKRRQEQAPSEFIALDTWVVPQLDVDDVSAMEEPLIQHLMESAPYFLSSSKQLPHFLVMLEKEERRLFGQRTDATLLGVRLATLGKKETSKVEILWGTWSFARADAVVHNAHLPLPLLRSNQLLQGGNDAMGEGRQHACKKRKPTGGGETCAWAAEGEEEVCLPVPAEAQFRHLMRLMAFPTEDYDMMVQAPVPRADFAKYGTVEKFIKARQKPGGTCHMCGDKHTDTIVGAITLRFGRADDYRLTAHHFSLKRNPRCKKVYTISLEAAAAYERRFEAQPQLGASEVAALGAACERAGAYLMLSRVWRLPDPAPGFEAHVAKEHDGRWRALMRPVGAAGFWHRFTAYPGLHYEYLQQAAWTSLGELGQKPPFWQQSA